MVIDLDPGEGTGLSECAAVALLVRDRVRDRRGMGTAYAVTSGSKGMHLYVSLSGRKNPGEVTEMAKELAEELAADVPKQVTATMTKAKRTGKVFLDWSQNSGSKTTLSPYSLRGKERPYVATPITWDEVEAAAEDPVALSQFRFEEVLERVEELGDLIYDLDADVS